MEYRYDETAHIEGNESVDGFAPTQFPDDFTTKLNEAQRILATEHGIMFAHNLCCHSCAWSGIRQLPET